MAPTTASITIQAPAQHVWDLLTDSKWWNDCENGVINFVGDIEEDGRISLVSTMQPGRTFQLNVSEFEPPRRMVWTDGKPLGLVQGVRTFEVDPLDENSCKFTVHENFSGLLLPLVRSSLPDLQEVFDAFAGALKRWAETEPGAKPAKDPPSALSSPGLVDLEVWKPAIRGRPPLGASIFAHISP